MGETNLISQPSTSTTNFFLSRYMQNIVEDQIALFRHLKIKLFSYITYVSRLKLKLRRRNTQIVRQNRIFLRILINHKRSVLSDVLVTTLFLLMVKAIFTL